MIALLVIAKGSDDEAPHLKRLLTNVSKHVDGVFINVNAPEGQKPSQKVLNVAKTFTDNVYETVWEDDFSKARNYVLDRIPNEFEWVIWLDTDDTLDKPKKVKEVAEESSKFDSVFVDYIYAKDAEGNITTAHLVARMFKNNGSHRWKGRIHETLIETRGVVQGMTKDFRVIHHSDDERGMRSHERNIKILEKQLEDEQKDPDPRTFYYLARAYYDSGMNAQAKEIYLDYLKLSGWDQERSQAQTTLGHILIGEGNRAEAKSHYMQAIGEDPDNPEPRVAMGALEIDLKQPAKAVHWLEGVVKMKKDLTTLERNPLNYTFKTFYLLSQSYMNMGGKHLKRASEYAQKALKYKKGNPDVEQYVKMVGQIYQDKLDLEDIVRKYKKYKEKGQKKKIKQLLENVPSNLSDNPIISALRSEGKSYKWPDKSICIMTGDTAIDEWGPWSLEEGIGGSEEAVIRLSRQLAKLGYRVVVFAKPGTGGLDEHGVMWRNYWEWNPKDKFDIFVAWRAPFIFEKKIKARKRYLWLHDVMEPGEFTPHRLANLDKVIVLSKYHRSLFPMIPDEKILLSGNGIDPEEFEALDGKFERDPHKMIYASSHVRGLAYLYEIWPDVKKAVPDATLDVYYGRESYDAVHKGNPERMKWMDDMIQKAKDLDGVTDHGKVSQQKITEETFKSGIWAYPCVTGDTLVDTPRDYSKYPLGVPIRKLVGKKNFPTWSYNEETGQFELKNVNWVARTKKKAKIIKVNWDDGTSLRCTPDHKIYTYDRGWVEAKNLDKGESVVALKKHAMFQVSTGQGKWPYEHRLIAEYTLGDIPKGHHVDHIDGNHLNNSPENLQILSPSEHASKTHKGQVSTKQLRERRKKSLAKWRATPEGKKQMSEIGRKRSQGFWGSMDLKERQEFVERRNLARYNHKVESIEDAGYEDVYDMNVTDNHNFIAGGVVVHNCPFPEIYCITAVKCQAAGAVPVASNYAALDETIQFGHKQPLGEFNKADLDSYKEQLIWWLQHPEEQEQIRPKMMAWARTQSWEAIAKQWHRSFQS